MTNNYKYKIESIRDPEKRELLFKIDFNSSQFENTELVEDVILQLNQLRENNIYQGIDFVKIDGRISMPLAYVFAHEIQHYVSAIAYKYPQKDYFIVTYTSTPNYQIGDTINLDNTVNKLAKLSPQTNSAFTAKIHENTLNINCKLGVVEGDVLTKYAEIAINYLINNGILKGGNLLKINGKSSMAVNMMIASKVAHLYSNVAVYDPKLSGYVISLRHGGEYAEGEFINDDSAQISNQKKIVICGNANRGKTVLRDGLNRAFNHYIPSENFFVISGCPDGDGAWFNDAYKNNPDKAKELKEKYKAQFTSQFAEDKAQQIRPINIPLVLFDVGGKMNNNQLTPENKIIMQEATHAVIVGGDETEIAVWRKCCQDLKIDVIAEVESIEKANEYLVVNNPIPDTVENQTPIVWNTINSEISVFRVTIQGLSRESAVEEYQEVQNLAKFLVEYNNLTSS